MPKSLPVAAALAIAVVAIAIAVPAETAAAPKRRGAGEEYQYYTVKMYDMRPPHGPRLTTQTPRRPSTQFQKGWIRR
jgi:hypothetical protein